MFNRGAFLGFLTVGMGAVTSAKTWARGNQHTIPEEQVRTLQKTQLGCPGLIEQVVLGSDKKKGFMTWIFDGKTTSASCKTSDRIALDPRTMEETLSKFEGTDLNLIPTYLNGCLDRKVSPGPGRNSTPVKRNISDDDRRAVIADFYWSLNKLKDQTKASQEVIASTDLLLGQRPFSGASEKQLTEALVLRGSAAYKSKLMSCPSLPLGSNGKTENFNDMVNLTQNALEQMCQLQRKRDALPLTQTVTVYNGGMGSTQIKVRDSAKEAHYYSLIESTLGIVPWLRSDLMKSLISEARYNYKKPCETQLNEDNEKRVAGALQSHLLANQEQVRKNISNYASSAICLSSTNPALSCKGTIQATFEKLPYWDPWKKIKEAGDPTTSGVEEQKFPYNEKGKVILSRAYLADAQCRHDTREIRSEMKSVVSGFATNVAITVASAGLGTVISGSRAAVMAGRAAQLSRLAQLSKAAMIGIDAIVVTQAGAAAVNTCDKALESHLSLLPEFQGNFDEPACSNSNESAVLMKDYKSCLLASIGAAAGLIATVPGNLAILRKIQLPGERLAAAGFDEVAASELTKAIVKRSASLPAKESIRMNFKALETLEKLGPDFAKAIKSSQHREAIGDTLVKLDELFGNRINPSASAALIKSITKEDAEGIEALNEMLAKAKDFQKQNPSLGELGALQKYLDDAKFDPVASQRLLSCIRSVF